MNIALAWPGLLYARGLRLSATPSARLAGRTLALAAASLLLLRLAGLG